jgi:hypothetical protein
MKAKTIILALTLCFALLQPQNASPQSARQKTEAAGAYNAATMLSGRAAARAASNKSNSAEAATLESTVRRDGLQFYFEIRNGGLAQLSKMASGLAPVLKLFKSGRKSLSADEITVFIMSNAPALSSARLALVNYAANGAAVLIEAASTTDAEQLHKSIVKLLATDATAVQSATTGADELDARLRGRVVIAGARATVARLARQSSSAAIEGDREFAKARERFSGDPFFGFIEMSGASIPLVPPGTGQDSAYAAGMLAALGSMPYAIALGGSIEADAVSVRALLLYGPKKNEGLLSSIMAAAHAGQSRAANFASPDAEMFIDVMLDWGKLYEAIESLFAMFASSAMANAASQREGLMQGSLTGAFDPLAAAEASLGFSIKHDLIPTLGNEFAVTLTGFGKLMNAASLQRKAAAASASTPGQAAKLPAPRFTLMLEVRDPVKFEKLMTQLLTKLSKAPPQPFARAQYRGATISYRKDMAYAITGGFMIAGGSAAEIRRALDAQALGVSLASSRNFQTAMGAPRPTMLQVYLSNTVSKSFYQMIQTQLTTDDVTLAAPKANGSRSQTPLGVVITPDADGTMIEMRVPTDLALMALSSMVTSKPAPVGVYSPYTGLESSNGAAHKAGGRKTPRLTDEDLRHRRP